MYLIVDFFGIISFISKEGTFGQGKKGMGTGKDIQSNRGVLDVSSGCDFKNRETGNAVYKDMVFVAPEELKVLFV